MCGTPDALRDAQVSRPSSDTPFVRRELARCIRVVGALIGCLLTASACSGREYPNEEWALMGLREIWRHEDSFMKDTGRPGSLIELIDGLPPSEVRLPQSFRRTEWGGARRGGYYFRVSIAEEEVMPLGGRWCAYAWPCSGQMLRTFVMWPDGFVYPTTGYDGLPGPPLDGAFPTGARGDDVPYSGRDGRQWRCVR